MTKIIEILLLIKIKKLNKKLFLNDRKLWREIFINQIINDYDEILKKQKELKFCQFC